MNYPDRQESRLVIVVVFERGFSRTEQFDSVPVLYCDFGPAPTEDEDTTHGDWVLEEIFVRLSVRHVRDKVVIWAVRVGSTQAAMCHALEVLAKRAAQCSDEKFVVNMSVLFRAGPRDGTHCISVATSNLARMPNVVVVCASGNDGQYKSHYWALVESEVRLGVRSQSPPLGSKLKASKSWTIQALLRRWPSTHGKVKLTIERPAGLIVETAVASEEDPFKEFLVGMTDNQVDRGLVVKVKYEAQADEIDPAGSTGAYTAHLWTAWDGDFPVEFDYPDSEHHFHNSYKISTPASSAEAITVGDGKFLDKRWTTISSHGPLLNSSASLKPDLMVDSEGLVTEGSSFTALLIACRLALYWSASSTLSAEDLRKRARKPPRAGGLIVGVPHLPE